MLPSLKAETAPLAEELAHRSATSQAQGQPKNILDAQLRCDRNRSERKYVRDRPTLTRPKQY